MVDLFTSLFNILIFINLYWYIIPPIFIPAIYYVFIRIFSFPLTPNKSHEFIIITRPEKATIKKVASRYHPFFSFKKGLYWFSTPCNDINSYNKYHIYIEGINQDVTEMNDRRSSKLDDILQTKLTIKQISGHQVKLLKNLKNHLNRHYTLTLEPNQKLAVLTPVKEPQPFKLSLYHTLGIYIQENQEVQMEEEIGSGNAKQILRAITTETVIKQIKYVQGYTYYSSSSAFNLLKKRLKIDNYFPIWLTGSTDPKLLATFIIMIAAIASIVLLSFAFKPTLAPMPTN